MKGLADIQVTLYDIFGYLFVGLAAFSSLSILTWAVVFPHAYLHEPHKLTSFDWFTVVIVAYVIGHLVQAIANWATEKFPSVKPKGRDAVAWMPQSNLIAQKVHLPTPRKNATAKEQEDYAYKLFELCDIVVAQKGVAGGDREIYQYREGFYRGLVVAFSMGFVAVIVRAAHHGDAVVGAHHVVTGWEYILVLLVIGTAIVLAYHRWLRFFNYKWHNTFGSFAVLTGLIQVPKT